MIRDVVFVSLTVPSTVRDLRLQAFGVAYVLLKWKPPLQPNGVIVGYDIAYQQGTCTIIMCRVDQHGCSSFPQNQVSSINEYVQ